MPWAAGEFTILLVLLDVVDLLKEKEMIVSHKTQKQVSRSLSLHSSIYGFPGLARIGGKWALDLHFTQLPVESFHLMWSRSRAGIVSNLLHGLIFY